MEYRHKNWGEIQVLQRYDTFWQVQTANGIRSANPADCIEVKENLVTFPTPPESPPPEPEPEPEPQTPEKKLRINLASAIQTARHLPMIGKLAARRIKERQLEQTDQRYADFEQFKSVNSDLVEEEAGWEKLEPLIDFGMP